jgi:hypothetical protein
MPGLPDPPAGSAPAEPDTIGFGVHFADVVFGQVAADGSWRPVS